MNQKNLLAAVSYYEAMNNQDLAQIAKLLDDEVEFIGPLAQFSGKDKVLLAAKGYFSLLNSVSIKEKFEDGHQAILVYEMDVKEIGKFRAVTLFTFKDELITRLELFYDARPFEQHQNRIFAQR